MPVVQIAAVAANGVIGTDGTIPWHLPEDFAHFKRTTLGHVLVMGRVTFESIGRPLPGRTTIVVTRDRSWSAPAGVLVAHSTEDALAQAAELDDQIYVAGGAQIYADAMAHADELLISEIPDSPDGDTHFPPIDPAIWREVDREPRDGLTVVRWERRA